ncbi:serine O-acetyltransferase [Ideonella sp.]|uniref:serine O-acetyltransferase n=1 Tax=Ideonella sp. TaxID=1929293 RepID=UPI0035B48674
MTREDLDPTWQALRAQARTMQAREPLLRWMLDDAVLAHADLAGALAHMLADKLCTQAVAREPLARALADAFHADPASMVASRRDVAAIVERDPSTDELLAGYLFHKGFHALQAHRAAHLHWRGGRHGVAAFLQHRTSEVFAVDIHPAARIGAGVFIDHATSVVIGETAVVGDDVSMLQEVTLGGTGKEKGDRHPKVGNGVLLCAGAKVLGNIRIGDGAQVGAGSVVLHHVRPYTTVVGVPARMVREFAPVAASGPLPVDDPALHPRDPIAPRELIPTRERAAASHPIHPIDPSLVG